VDAADESHPEEPAVPPAQPGARAPSRKAALEARVVSAQARAKRLAERAQDEREHHASVDVAFQMADRDADAGGEIIAGALAYRIFIWLLPLALVAVAGLGFAADATSESAGETARSLGITGLVSNSVATAAQGSARWYALLVGVPLLVYVTRSLLRALIVTHRLLWGDVRSTALRPTLPATARLLALLLCFSVVSLAASAFREWASGPGLLVTILLVLPYAGLWLLVSLQLPHGGSDWKALVPGALLCGAGIELLHIFTAYVLEPYAVAKEGTYGAMGAAAALLLGLFLLSRLVVAGALLNATLWERRDRARAAGAGRAV
jgi:uncharacterized BrkB/YihY/UPF0761 family membrane protein